MSPLATRLLWLGLLLAGQPAWGERPARKLLDENRLEEAVAVCRQFEVLSTYDKENFMDCAWVYFRLGNVDGAEKLMDRLRANYAQPEYQLLAAYGLIAKKDFEKARVALDGLMTKFKGGGLGVRVTETRAELYEAMGQLNTAAFLYKQVIGEKPGSAIAHWGLGRFYLSQGELMRAKGHLEKTAQLWPRHLASRYNLAVIALQVENDRDAARWLAECYKLDKGDPGVLEQLGNLYERKRLLTEAVKYWQRALAINPKSTIAAEKLGKYVSKVLDRLIDAKQWKEAMEQIEAVSQGKELSGPMLLRRGIVHRNMAQYDRALGDLLKYVSETKSPEGEVYRELGICYVNLKLIDQAGANFLQATVAEPGEGMNWAWLAFALESKGEFKKARDAWRKAVEYLKDPEELSKAARRLATLESKLGADEPSPGPKGKQ